MNTNIKKTGRKFKYTENHTKASGFNFPYNSYFKKGEIYEEATDDVSDFVGSLLSGLLSKLESKPISLLTKDIDGKDVVITVHEKDVELIECSVNCNCLDDERIPSNEEEFEKAKQNAEGQVKIEIIDSGDELSVSIVGSIDKRVLKKALENILKDL